MNHIALYRAWRPQTFQDIVGQSHITQTLQNSLVEGRLSHAYLFNGPRGTGKTSAAKVLAKAVNCERGPAPEPCNECGPCIRITTGAVIDVQEIDAASNRGVEEIRDIRDKVKYAPTEVRRKVYIIDEVHMLTTEAFNALLKTLEEPPEHVMFILATTEPHKLPATIISRCQRFDFRRVSLEEQVSRLRRVCDAEKVPAEEEALRYVARLSDGGMRDALSILDQSISFAPDGAVRLEEVVRMTGGVASDRLSDLALALKQGEMARVLELVDTWMQEGKSAEKCLEQSLHFFRDVLLFQMVPPNSPAAERLSPEALQPVAEAYSREELFAAIDLFNRYLTEMKYATHPQTLLEVALMKACTGADIKPHAKAQTASVGGPELNALLGRISKLEEQLAAALKGGGLAATGAAPAASSRERSSPPTAPRSKLDLAKLEGFIKNKDEVLFKQMLGKWAGILQQVKERRVTVHAWLMDGEPVSAQDDVLLVGFKNSIHRETTEKPANKQLIEQVISETAGKSLRLMTVMLRDWNEVSSGASKEAEKPFQLEQTDPDEGEGSSPDGREHKEPWINEAIQMFGEDLVVIKDDE
ncbi:DNA polymerase III subunit gamma/tau [Paenibacillus turpanensis]|uniref:DNA polymerase III subunit gamma/tau n=1 Tax=Paenibacillus turpanensis TaxID=2689078 RepID=UPI00140A097F|nr:DNA polymerase III subunit gamma/tau [Paenibacillus turpanensis]